jgi:hypothetical protein
MWSSIRAALRLLARGLGIAREPSYVVVRVHEPRDDGREERRVA